MLIEMLLFICWISISMENTAADNVSSLHQNPFLEQDTEAPYDEGKDRKASKGITINQHQIEKRNIIKKIKTVISNTTTVIHSIRMYKKRTPESSIQLTVHDPDMDRAVDMESLNSKPVMRAGSWTSVSSGKLPRNAFVAGYDFDGTRIYIGKGKIPKEQSVVPGRVSAFNSLCVEVAWRNWGRCLRHYQVLTGNKYKWVVNGGKVTRTDAIPAGFENSNSDPYYVCRYMMNQGDVANRLLIGKVIKNACEVANNGRLEYFINYYELLVRK